MHSIAELRNGQWSLPRPAVKSGGKLLRKGSFEAHLLESGAVLRSSLLPISEPRRNNTSKRKAGVRANVAQGFANWRNLATRISLRLLRIICLGSGN